MFRSGARFVPAELPIVPRHADQLRSRITVTIERASVASERGWTRSAARANDTTASPCSAATFCTAARGRALIGKIQITRLARARMRSRLARRPGLSGSLLPADTTFTAAEGSTRAITAFEEMPILALTLHARM